MYTMKDVCDKVNITYDTLKYYCKEGLIKDIKRNSNNHRVFDDEDLRMIHGIKCLRQCGMSINDIRDYVNLVYEGNHTIPQRRLMLDKTQKNLHIELNKIKESLHYIENKNKIYDEMEKQLKQ